VSRLFATAGEGLAAFGGKKRAMPNPTAYEQVLVAWPPNPH
jgi:hypothetical protein